MWREAGGLLGQLRALDDIFDVLLLPPSLIVVAPPHWSLVLAGQAEMLAGLAFRFPLIALLSSQSACEAA